MPRHSAYIPAGVIPAVLLPFDDDLAIDEKSFRSPPRADVAATDGLSGVTVNAHSTEVASCSFDEQRRVHGDCCTKRWAIGCRSCTASGPTAAWRPRGSPRRRRRAVPRRSSCFRRDRSPSGRMPRWRSPISGASPMPRPTCR